MTWRQDINSALDTHDLEEKGQDEKIQEMQATLSMVREQVESLTSSTIDTEQTERLAYLLGEATSDDERHAVLADTLTQLGQKIGALERATPVGDRADLRDFGASTAGVVGRGNASKDTAALIDARDQLSAQGPVLGIGGGPSLDVPAGRFYVEDEIVWSRPVPMRGDGTHATYISPTPDLAGGKWMLDFSGMVRTKSETFANHEYMNPLETPTGETVESLTFLGDRRSGQINGVKHSNSADDVYCRAVNYKYFKGVGLQLGDHAPNGIRSGGIIRESLFDHVRILECGDWDTKTAEFPDGIPGMDVTQADDLAGTSDGTNQLVFNNFWYVWNQGRLWIQNQNDTEIMRRIVFNNFMLHGNRNGGASWGSEDDLMVIEGHISGVTINEMRTNSCHPSKAVIRWKANKHGLVPRRQRVTNFGAASLEGHLFAVDRIGDLYASGAVAAGDFINAGHNALDIADVPGAAPKIKAEFFPGTSAAPVPVRIPARFASTVKVTTGME